jgi:ferrous iron transport protein A
MSLNETRKGEQVILESIDGGYAVNKKLRDMGLTPGVPMTVLSAPSFGPMIVQVRGTRLALGRGILSKIIVSTGVI